MHYISVPLLHKPLAVAALQPGCRDPQPRAAQPGVPLGGLGLALGLAPLPCPLSFRPLVRSCPPLQHASGPRHPGGGGSGSLRSRAGETAVHTGSVGCCIVLHFQREGPVVTSRLAAWYLAPSPVPVSRGPHGRSAAPCPPCPGPVPGVGSAVDRAMRSRSGAGEGGSIPLLKGTY